MFKLFVIAAITLVAEAANAQTLCANGKTLFEEAKRRFGEHIIGAGQINGGTARIIVLASKSGSFTVTTLDTNGNACIVAVGDGWEQAGLPEDRY